MMSLKHLCPPPACGLRGSPAHGASGGPLDTGHLLSLGGGGSCALDPCQTEMLANNGATGGDCRDPSLIVTEAERVACSTPASSVEEAQKPSCPTLGASGRRLLFPGGLLALDGLLQGLLGDGCVGRITRRGWSFGRFCGFGFLVWKRCQGTSPGVFDL